MYFSKCPISVCRARRVSLFSIALTHPPRRFHSTTPSFDSDPETIAATTLPTTRTLAAWPTAYPIQSAARRRVNRMHPAVIPGDDKAADFARKMVHLAVRIVRGSVFETGVSTMGLGQGAERQVMQEVIFVPRMADEEGV